MANIRQIIFTGTFPSAVDAKTKRLTIPAKWRLKPDQEFYLTPNANGQCLSVFTNEEYQKAFDRIDALTNVTDEQKAAAKRLLGARTHTAFCDIQGRVVMDAEHLKWAGISTKAVLIGRVSNFEVWSPEKWKEVEASSPLSLESITKMMGL